MNLLRCIIFLFISHVLLAQAPSKMSYQVVIRNASGTLLANKTVGIRLSILQGNTPVYVETHTPLTNANGLASLEIGSGNIVSGVFGAIDWANGSYFIKSETDPQGGTNYNIVGTSQLLSVPYSLYAEKSGPKGTSVGDMLYWDGTQWVKIPAGKNGQLLIFCDGKPTWGLCVPYATTLAVSNLGSTSAVVEGMVGTGGGTVTDVGFYYGTAPNPTASDNRISMGSNSKTGKFTATLQQLTPNVTYYVRAYGLNEAGVGYGEQLTFKPSSTYVVGQAFGGGIIFYVDNTGQHGLIASTLDLETSGGYNSWGCFNVEVATDSTIGSGKANTLAMANCSDTLYISWADVCLKLNRAGYSDWYIPSQLELDKLYSARALVGGFKNDNYWSSTQGSKANAWIREFNTNGYKYPVSKSSGYNVRPIRSF